jgi:hypothetical protein
MQSVFIVVMNMEVLIKIVIDEERCGSGLGEYTAQLHTVPLKELIESVERARRDAQLGYVVTYRAACSYCLGRAERLEGSYLRTLALELKEQLHTSSQRTHGRSSHSVGAARRIRGGSFSSPIIDLLQQVMCPPSRKGHR